MKAFIITAMTIFGLSFNSHAAEKNSNVPLQIDGVPIYAGLSSDTGYQGTEIATRVCIYFGFNDVNSYTRGWSVDAAKEIKQVIVVHNDRRMQIIDSPEGFNTFSKLVCE